MLTKFPEEKEDNATAVPALIGRLRCSTKKLSGVGETDIGIVRSVHGIHSHWETISNNSKKNWMLSTCLSI